MPKQPKKPNSDESERQTYSSIGIIFLLSGLGLLLPEDTRVTGIPFVILGLTFLTISYNPKAKK